MPEKKPFLTYEQQIHKLRDEKGLVIPDEAHAMDILTQIGYFSLVNGYKTPFKESANGRYKAGTTFEDVENLYYFDEALRELFFKYLLKVEQKLKSHISYYFSEEHGNSINAYTSLYNYDYQDPKKVPEIFRLLGEINRIITANFNAVNLNHYIVNYENIPLWVLMRKLTFGNVSKMLDMLPMPLQTKISKSYSYLTSTSQLSAIISVLVLFRNTCAHNDRLYNYRSNKGELPPLRLHKELGLIRLPNGNYLQGKQDLFAVIIALRYLLEDTNFPLFFRALEGLLQNHPDNAVFPKIELIKSMGFPANWREAAVLPV
ncbi:Abi family protein [Spirochaetia bacterium]|nr:Abi family protein [Spirochaetia bacterium]